MKENHYHYLIIFQKEDGISHRLYETSRKLSPKDIIKINKGFNNDNNCNAVITGFYKLECDCNESN